MTNTTAAQKAAKAVNPPGTPGKSKASRHPSKSPRAKRSSSKRQFFSPNGSTGKRRGGMSRVDVSTGSAHKRRKLDLSGLSKEEAKAAKKRAKENEKIIAKREKEAHNEPKWPKRALAFKCWHDEAFDKVRAILIRRGFKDLGNICSNSNYKELSDVAKCSKPYNLPRHTLPRRCLWWVHEDDGRRLKNLPEESMMNARHCISTFLGTDAAVTKVAVTRMNDDEPWYPKAFVLPLEGDKLLKYVKKNKSKRYWIAKPRNEYAGRGVRVFDCKSDAFKTIVEDKTQKEFVIQHYLHKPLLVGGFKFHFRMYTVLTGVLDNFEAYLYKDGHALFCTKEYTLGADTIGKNFDTFTHLTNWSINFVKGNPDLQRDKEVIGVGCEWAVGSILKEIKRCHPTFDEDKFWKEMTMICATTMYKIAQWKHVAVNKKQNDAHPRFENFGLDVMMDDKFNIYLMEGNTQVGLNAIMENFPDKKCTMPSWKQRVGDEPYCTKNGCPECRGGKNIRYKENNKVLDDLISGSIDLKQLDVPRSKRVNRKFISLHDVVNSETMKGTAKDKAWRERMRSSSRGRRADKKADKN